VQHMFHEPAASPILALSELCSALPSLPMRLREVGRFVAANDYDATTRSMRGPGPPRRAPIPLPSRGWRRHWVIQDGTDSAPL